MTGGGRRGGPADDTPPGADAVGRFLDAVDKLPMGVHVYRLGPGGRLVFAGANPAADRILGVDNRAFVGQAIEEAFPPLAQTEVPERYRRAAAQGVPWMTEQITYQHGAIAGAYVVQAFHVGPGAMAAAFLDITERKRSEAALEESRTLYHDLVETAQDLIWQVDADGRYTYVNPAWEVVLGYRAEEMIGKRFSDFQTPEFAERDRREFARLLRGNVARGLETVHLARDGREVHLVFNAKRFTDAAGAVRGTRGTAFDITERKAIERELRRNEELLHEAQHVARLGHYELEVPADRWTSSPVLDDIFGIGPEYPRTAAGWLAIVHPDDREAMGDYLTREVLAGNRPFNREYRIRRVADGAERWVHGIGSLATDEAGLVTRMFGIIQDVTDRKRAEAERRRLEAQVLHAQKLESLGVLAGGIAHDFNNILMSVVGHAGLARMRLPAGSPALENLAQIELAAERAADLARQMLAYSGKGTFVVGPVNLSRLVRELEHLLRVSISKKAGLRLDLAEPLAAVEADATQLRQVVMNLVINASEAIGDAPGTIAVATGCATYAADELRDYRLDEAPPEGRYVRLEVADDGCGMSDETRARIFDPFFSSKFTGRGLGLAAVIGIVRGHRGGLRVTSEPGRGSTFTVLLPAAAGDAATASAAKRAGSGAGARPAPAVTDAPEASAPAGAAPDPAASRQGPEVLLVDDEENVRTVGGEMLAGNGFRVVQAGDGEEALERYRERRPDVVLLDLTMPRMDGVQAFRALRALDPGARIVLSSGYNESDDVRALAAEGLAGFLRKPYSAAALVGALRGALGG